VAANHSLTLQAMACTLYQCAAFMAVRQAVSFIC
jgi:hypothetical protein